MTVPTVDAQDATSVNEGAIPSTTLACGYTTGSGGIMWSPAQFAARTTPFPPIRIDQDPSASDQTADILDVESGAATLDDIVPWIRAARANFARNARMFQREPAVYLAMGNLDGAVSRLQSAGLTNVGFWTAQPGNTHDFAVSRVATAIGPYPCIGCQYEFGSVVDFDVFSLTWVSTMAGTTITKPTLINEPAKVALVRVVGTHPVYWWNGTALWHVPDPSVLTFMRNAGITVAIQDVSQSEFNTLGPVVA